MVGTTSRRGAGLAAVGFGAIGLALGLAGCDTLPVTANVGRGDIRNAIARGQMTSPKAATVALVSLEGAPAPIVARFRQSLAAEAANREITITDEPSARYLVRGYLSAYPSERGTSVAYVYDVYDAAEKRREDRIEDAIEVPGAPADPWSVAGDGVIASLAGRSADDLAVALAGTPEAQAAAGKVASAGPMVR